MIRGRSIQVQKAVDNRIAILIQDRGEEAREVLLRPEQAGQLARDLWEITQDDDAVELQLETFLNRGYGHA